MTPESQSKSDSKQKTASVEPLDGLFYEKGAPPQYDPVLGRVLNRRRVAASIFATADSFAAFLAQRLPDEKVREAWLRQAAATNLQALELLAVDSNRPELLKAADAEKYYALAIAGYVEPALDFPDEVPPTASLCQAMALKQKYPDGHAPAVRPEVVEEARLSYTYFVKRWQLLTGVTPFQGQPPALPRVGDLACRKAPIPLSPGWTPDLYTAEARAMHHRLPGDAAPAAQSGAPAAAARAAAAAPAEAVPAEGNGAAAPARPACCDVGEIFRQAGVPRPQPRSDDSPRYTFPGTLGNTEEIFYDYVVIRPVNECGPFHDDVAYDPRDLAAPQLLAARARSVLFFLHDMHLDDVLGQRLDAQGDRVSFGYDQLNAVLTNVDELVGDSDLAKVQAVRRALRRQASVLRLVGRTEINLAGLGAQDPVALKDGLVEAMARFDHLFLYQDLSIVRDVSVPALGGIFGGGPSPPPTDVNYLGFHGIHPAPSPGPAPANEDLTAGDVAHTESHYFLEVGNQARHTKYYLEYLGSTFYDNIIHLRAKVGEVVAALGSLQSPADVYRKQFTDLATDLIYHAVSALARLLEEAAETLDLPPRRRKDGSKRLAVMLVYRQHWCPSGYVKGKLVGYKNLAPGQKDRVYRRTFIRTVRETTSVQEFAATRSQDHSQSLKETAEFVRENALKFNLTTSASGHFDILIGGIDASVSSALDLSQSSRETQSRMAEVVAKSSVQFNEKREVKVREQVEAEEAVETTSELQNANQEITANYFYYQLLRQYDVWTEFNDIRPVLLRTRQMPDPAEVDDHFLNAHAHVLVGALPLQLAADLQSTVHRIDPLARAMIRRRVEAEQQTQAYKTARDGPPPSDVQLRQDWEARLQSMERVAADARRAFAEAEGEYLPARARMDRVVAHVREHIAYYMQYLWNNSPTVDHDQILAEEKFGGMPLPDLTRGLMRQGYYGDEEIFEFDGPSIACADLLARHTVSASELLAGRHPDAEPTLARLRSRFGTVSDAAVQHYVFVRDPAGREVINRRTVQLAQEALVVETIPGQVPLLEGFKLAHRMLDVEKACLENEHLRARIADKPWTQGGEDTYRVIRREADGAAPPLTEKASS